MPYTFFISKYGQATASKLPIFSRFLVLKFAYWLLKSLTKVTYICKKYSKFQDSKSLFMISGFNIFPIILLGQLNFGVLLV